MYRRGFLRSAGVASLGTALAKTDRLFAGDTSSTDWRRFEVTTRVEVRSRPGQRRCGCRLPSPARRRSRRRSPIISASRAASPESSKAVS